MPDVGLVEVRGTMIRSLWFLVGFLTGVVSTGLGFLWMMAMAVLT